MKKNISDDPGSVFRFPQVLIWITSVFISILASIPKILRLHIYGKELAADLSIAFIFSLTVWFYNLSNLEKHDKGSDEAIFFSRRLGWSIFIGFCLMASLVMLHQQAFPQYHLQSMLLLYEFRGLTINLTIYLFLHLLYQAYLTRIYSVELERAKAANLNARFELLKQQVNPHFLFNSLSTLKSMVDMGDEHAGSFIVKLSDFYRHTFENKKNDLIPLYEELEILDAYIFLLEARFENGIRIEIVFSNAIRQTFIPPFTLQLLIENCIKHNIVSLEKPLFINIFENNGTITVRNQLQPKKKPELSTKRGIENINERYQMLTGQSITISKSDAHFSIEIPVINRPRSERNNHSLIPNKAKR